MGVSSYKYLTSLLLVFLFSSFVSADFTFQGYVQFFNGSVPGIVNVSVYEIDMQQWAVINTTINASIDTATGAFTMDVAGNSQNMYRLRIYAYADAQRSLVMAMSPPSLPDFPDMMYEQPQDPMMPSLFNQTIYLVPATTVNITAFRYVPASQCGSGANQFYCKPDTGIPVGAAFYNESNSSFMYMVSDTNLGMPVAEDFLSSSTQALIILTTDRNYSLELMPDDAPPVNYPLYLGDSDTGTIGSHYVNMTFDIQNVSGYILENGTTEFLTSSTNDVTIMTFMRSPGKNNRMIPIDAGIPRNIMANEGMPDSYDETTGEFYLSLPGTVGGMEMWFMVFANKSNGDTYTGVRNITVDYAGPPMAMGQTEIGINLSVYPTSIDSSVAQVSEKTFGIDDFLTQAGSTNISSSFIQFTIQGQNQNGSGFSAISMGFLELEVTYNVTGASPYTVYYNDNIQQQDQGIFTWAFPNDVINAKINIFSDQYAPRSTTINITNPVQVINLSSFDMKHFDENGTETEMNMSEKNFGVEMWRAGTIGSVNCDALYPDNESVCRMGDPISGGFNPMQAMMAGIINFRMYLPSGVELRMMGTDLLASGPPDAMMGEDGSTTTAGDALEEAWKFGSMAPDIYNYVFIGIPLDTSTTDVTQQINVSIPYLYDDNDNVIFNLSAGQGIPDVGNLSDYSDYLPDYQEYFTANGVPCSTSNLSTLCYINVTDLMLWIKIPHFSSIAPTIKGTALVSTGGGRSTISYPMMISVVGDSIMKVGKSTVFLAHRSDDPEFTLYGIVVDILLEGIRVFNGVTDADGLISFRPSSPGAYELRATDNLYNGYNLEFSVQGASDSKTTTTQKSAVTVTTTVSSVSQETTVSTIMGTTQTTIKASTKTNGKKNKKDSNPSTTVQTTSTLSDSDKPKIVGGVIAKTTRGSIFTNPVIWSLSFIILLVAAAVTVFGGALMLSSKKARRRSDGGLGGL